MATGEPSNPVEVPPSIQGPVPTITGEILEAYLNCKYKGYLRLIGLTGTPSDHEVLMKEVRQELRRRASESLERRYREDEILRAPVVTPSMLRTGPLLILDAIVQDGGFSLKFEGLKRLDAPTRQVPLSMPPSWSSRARRSARSTAKSWRSMP